MRNDERNIPGLPALIHTSDGGVHVAAIATRELTVNTVAAYEAKAKELSDQMRAINYWLPRMRAALALWRPEDTSETTFAEVVARVGPARVIEATKLPDGRLRAEVRDSSPAA